MTIHFVIKYLHVLGAIVILGTGIGIAFFMLMAHRSGDAAFIARTAAIVVLADTLFTLTAVILQPITGGVLMFMSSTTLAEGWLAASLLLYAIAGLFWVMSGFIALVISFPATTAILISHGFPPAIAVPFAAVTRA